MPSELAGRFFTTSTTWEAPLDPVTSRFSRNHLISSSVFVKTPPRQNCVCSYDCYIDLDVYPGPERLSVLFCSLSR